MANGFLQSGFAGTTPNFNPVPNILTNTSPNPVNANALQQPMGTQASGGNFLGNLMNLDLSL